MISICIPSRKRPELFKRFCLSVLSTASDPYDIEFVVYRDMDDESVYEYFGNFKEVKGERIYCDASFNECQKNATGPLYLFAADDFVFETNGWDHLIRKLFDESKDKIIFAFLKDHRANSNYGSIGCLHKNWIDTVGFFFNPALVKRGDVWINQLAKNINRHVCINAYCRHSLIIEDEVHKDMDRQIERTDNYRLYYTRTMKALRRKNEQDLRDFVAKNAI